VRFISLLTALSAVLAAGCGKSLKASDPQLQPIQEMLDASLPPGTPSSVVNQFVSTRGYTVEPSGKADAMIVVIRHIDKQKLQPVTARVTFHFDSNDKLVSTDILRTLNQPQIPSQPQTQAQP
jgi:hypothetical protein